MICRHCNAKVKRGMKRCPYCGERLVDYRIRMAALTGVILALVLIVWAVTHLYAEGGGQTGTAPEPVHTTEGTEESAQTQTEEEQTEETEAQKPAQESTVTQEPTQESTEASAEETTESTTQEAEQESTEASSQEEEGESLEESPQEVSDRWAGMTPGEVSIALEQEEFSVRMQYALQKGWLIEEPIEMDVEPGTRSRTLKPDVLYTEEILQGLENGSFQMQAFSAPGYPDGEAEYQVYRRDGLSEPVAIRYTVKQEEEEDGIGIYTFIFHGGDLRYVENYDVGYASWFMNDVMTARMSLQEAEALGGCEIQNRSDYFELDSVSRQEYRDREQELLNMAYGVYERAVTERNYVNIQLQLVLQDTEGSPMDYDIEEAGVTFVITSDALDPSWDGLSIEQEDFYYVDNAGWCTDFYLPAASLPYTITIRSSLSEEQQISLEADYDFLSARIYQYVNIGQVIIETDVLPSSESSGEME